MLQAIHQLFNNPTARRAFLWLRYPITLAVIAWVALSAQREWFWAAFAVSAVGEAIQVWAFASLVKNEELTARGPYVLVRNPMYLGRYFLILGFLLLAANVWAAVAYTILYYFYMFNRVMREEKRLAELLGEPYRKYCASTQRFMPTLSRLADPALRYFNVAVLTRNNGHWNLLSMLVAWGAVYAYIALFR